ncbi:uncharacterized protein LOC131345824 isoform X2 [Hemibagrus wyckioides]|uniref:uncharacterized protein LOC131345824 isoform X2 n=1 Tax=Hemibagrus wyckioides TaxID=337641 RepID=UPI00266C5E96|nr:uncharacterized protein LOC131345824 isoform X2 [Hemibagrus wyckioides]
MPRISTAVHQLFPATARSLRQQNNQMCVYAVTSPPPPPPVFEISIRNRFAPLRKAARDAVIIGHVRATAAKGKVHTRCFPGARVVDVAAQVRAILTKNIGAMVLHAGTNDIRLRQTEILKKDFKNLVEKVRTTLPPTRIIVSGPLPTFQRGIERLYHYDGLHRSRAGAAVLSDNIPRALHTI